MIRHLACLTAAALLTLAALAHVASAQTTDITYVYDELGRLVGVIDANGDAAVYRYDAVGNLLSIARFGPTDVSIFEWSPNRGPVGSSVTIGGTGFSATSSQNTVEFNGTAATVSSATPNRLDVTVPAGATTGPISVSTPNGNVTSASDFIVTSSASAVSISSLTPTAGVA
jgi:YD repeat-containing protein